MNLCAGVFESKLKFARYEECLFGGFKFIVLNGSKSAEARLDLNLILSSFVFAVSNLQKKVQSLATQSTKKVREKDFKAEIPCRCQKVAWAPLNS